MDIDIPDVSIEELSGSQQVQAQQPAAAAPIVVDVDEAHPFDVEAYISSYSSRSAIYRLLFVLEFCPSLAQTTFPILEKHLKEGRDIALYKSAVGLYNRNEGLQKVEMDPTWSTLTEKANTSERNKLEVELKTYTANSIKESIRMAHRDLGNFYRATGDENAALKHYVKARENCTAAIPQPMLEISLLLIELALEQRNFTTLGSFIFKAESALDAMASAAAGPASGAKQQLMHKRTGPSPSAEREKFQLKFDIASGIALLGQGSYEKAALTFLRASAPANLEDWNGKIISPADIAVYGTLCALATLSRGAINAQILQSESFSIYLEHEPYIRQILSAYMSSKFKIVLELLEKHSAKHCLDVYLGPHIAKLTNLIRDRALVMYFQPFATVKLDRMAAAFGLPIDKLTQLTVALIKNGSIKGRIDSKNGILKANVVDQRQALFNRALQAGAHIESTNRKLLLRMQLQQADLIVRPPKNQNQTLTISPAQLGLLTPGQPVIFA